MVQSPVQLPVSGSQSRARGRRVEPEAAEQGRPRDPMPPQLKTPYHENSSIVAGVDGVVEPLDLVRFRSRWPPRPGLPPPAGAKRPRRRKRTVALPLLTGTRPPARAQRPPTPLPERSDPVAANKQSRSRSAQQRSALPPPCWSRSDPGAANEQSRWVLSPGPQGDWVHWVHWVHSV